MSRRVLSLALFSLLTVIALSNVSSACIGEIAGKIHFNISAGESQTLQMMVFNSCGNVTINYDAIARIDSIPNKTTPTIVAMPKHGVLQPSQTLPINIIVSMPANAIAGTFWSGGVAAVESANQTISGGANINSGVVKIITVTALPPKTNYALIELILIALVASIGIAAGGIYYYTKVRVRRKKRKKARARRARKRRKARKRTGKKRRARRARRTRRRRRR